MKRPIAVIDMFAGCGGLGEGFAAPLDGQNSGFNIELSIEKDAAACSSILLREFYRKFDHVPDEYYSYLHGRTPLQSLSEKFSKEWSASANSIFQTELGDCSWSFDELYKRISKSIAETDAWVLVGGPPCQAYSSSGRSRNKGTSSYVPELDHRHYLYRHFLDVIAKFAPPVFLMENVTGLLTAKVGGEGMFKRICNDLENPGLATGSKPADENYNLAYQLYPLAQPAVFDLFHKMENKPASYIVNSSEYGVAQSRNRVFLLGVRTDLKKGPKLLQKHERRYTVHDFIGDLPKVRSGLSKEDCGDSWLSSIRDIVNSKWFQKLRKNNQSDTSNYIAKIIENTNVPKADRGGRFVKNGRIPRVLQEWFYDPRLGGVCNHEARSHMSSDLHRYIFMASETMRREDLYCRTEAEFSNVTLADFPDDLLPDHKNVNTGSDKSKIAFPDRFKVQRRYSASSTIVSHLKSDGHYFIHYDPEQCRSLTVREAARLQSFPDNFFFEGSRSDAYQQIGNAVPPYLAQQIAVVIKDLLKRNNII